MKKLFSGLLLASLTSTAFAVPITIDADDYSIGTNILYPNDQVALEVLHRHVDGSLDVQDMIIAPGPVYETGAPGSAFGNNSFGFVRDNGTISGWTFGVGNFDYFYSDRAVLAEYGAMTIRFFDPVQYLSVKGGFSNDPLAIRAYDSEGELLHFAYGNFPRLAGCLCSVGTMEISRAQADIAYVIVGGSQGAGYINEFTYDVPEPTSLGLLALGLVSGVVSRLRKKQAI